MSASEFVILVERADRHSPWPWEWSVHHADVIGQRADKVTEYRDLPWEEQAKAGIDPGHSGNTFGFACHLARLWIIGPEAVVTEHGAMVPLVGCKDYGCTHEDAA